MQNLAFGTVFVRNDVYEGLVVQCARTEDSLVVISHTSSGVKGWAVAHISIEGEFFYHRSMRTFFTLQGALKEYCALTGENLDDTIDDHC